MEGINDASSGQPAYAAARFSSDQRLAEVPPWDPDSGVLVVGVDLSEKQFVAKMPVGLLAALVRDPSRSDITPDQGGAGQPYRAMSSANRRNIQPYVNYILERVPTADAGL